MQEVKWSQISPYPESHRGRTPGVKSCPRIRHPHVYWSKQHIVSLRVMRVFNTTKQYCWDLQGSYRTMRLWQLAFIGLNMTHCLLAKTEHQQETDSKNKDQAPSAFPHILYISPWYWHSRRGVVHKEPVGALSQSVRQSAVWATGGQAGWSHWCTLKRVSVQICRCEQGSLECMSEFNKLRAKAYSNIHWHTERSTWLERIWKVTPVK